MIESAGLACRQSTETEALKHNPSREAEVFPMVRPVVEKMAMIVKNSGGPAVKQPMIFVGGTVNFTDSVATFSNVLRMPVYKPTFPQYITPLGIAMADHD